MLEAITRVPKMKVAAEKVSKEMFSNPNQPLYTPNPEIPQWAWLLITQLSPVKQFFTF